MTRHSLALDHPYSRVIHYDAGLRASRVMEFGLRANHLGGGGLVSALYASMKLSGLPWNAEEQPLVFAVGPLTGLYPMMSKCVCGFRSPCTGQWTESYAGGSLALALRFAGYDALVLTGRAAELSCLVVDARGVRATPVPVLRGADVFRTAEYLRRAAKNACPHCSVVGIGPAGENGVTYAGINVDLFHHFSRFGAGAALGGKNIKGVLVVGDGALPLPKNKAYPALCKALHDSATALPPMRKQHGQGSLPPLDPPPQGTRAAGEPPTISFSPKKIACAGCPAACVDTIFLHGRAGARKRALYDCKLLASLGSALRLADTEQALFLMDEIEKGGLDCTATTGALARAAVAGAEGLISDADTLVPLRFGDWKGFHTAVGHLAAGSNEFYRLLGRGAAAAAEHYAGRDFARLLVRETAGRGADATCSAAHTPEFRPSHLANSDSDANGEKVNTEAAVRALLDDDKERTTLSAMAACLFARDVYTMETLQECLTALGMQDIALALPRAGAAVQALGWKLKLETGCNPRTLRLPGRAAAAAENGGMDSAHVHDIQRRYAEAIARMADAAAPA